MRVCRIAYATETTQKQTLGKDSKRDAFHLLLLGLVTAGQALEIFLLLVGLSLAGRHDGFGVETGSIG